MKQFDFDDADWIYCALPTLASIAWVEFDRLGLMRKVRSIDKVEDGIAAAIHRMSAFLDRHKVCVAQISAIKDNGGASWLNPNAK